MIVIYIKMMGDLLRVWLTIKVKGGKKTRIDFDLKRSLDFVPIQNHGNHHQSW